MKKIIKAIFLVCLIVIAGCSRDVITIPEQQIEEGKEVTVSFTTSVPEFKTVVTRANGGVNNMYLLVFDENGSFIARRTATLTNQTETGGTFTASLPSSSSKRTVHFVSNLEVSAFNDSPGVNEATVVALLSTTNATFWSRVELSNGISVNSFTGLQVELLRNQAKISVKNEASNFATTGFVIHNAPDKGTVAPYSTIGGFVEGTITEPSGVVLLPAIQTNISTTDKYLFERKNATASEITTVIMQGTYEGQTYFYKIDLIDADKNRYEIERNYHYIVTIKTVTRAGYSSFDDALAGASHNNTALDPVIERYPMISDGVGKLEVEKTLVILTQPNQTFQVWAKFFPDITSDAVDNSEVTVTLQTGNAAIVASSLSFNPSTGIISGTGLGTLPEEPGVALIRVSKGELARTVRVQLRPPFSFDPVTINNVSPGVLQNGQSQDAYLRFTIPNDFPDDLFPLPVKIYSQGLYPASTGLEMVVESGQIHYIYRTASKGEKTVYFKSNKSFNSESITLKADYFVDGEVGYEVVLEQGQGKITYGNSIKIPVTGNVSVSPGSIEILADGIYKYTRSGGNDNTAVTLTFDNKVSGDNNSYYIERYTIQSTNQQLENGTTLNMDLTEHVFRGTLRWYRNGNNNGNINQNQTVTISPAITDGTFTRLGDGYYMLVVPASTDMNTSITFTYNRNTGGSQGTYTLTRTLDAMKTNYNLQLNPQ